MSTRIYELRVHGVHGTPAEDMLGDPYPRQVAGDTEARFLRSRHPADRRVPGRDATVVREAFHWSRFTSGSRWNALWLLLLPFALVNLARFMLLTRDDAAHDESGRTWWDRFWSAVAFGVLRLLGLGMTLLLVISVWFVAAEILVNRCVLSERCVGSTGVWAGWTVGQAALLPLLPVGALLLVVGLLGRRSRVHDDGDRRTRRMRDRQIDDAAFWKEAAEVRVLRRLHLAAATVVVGALYAGLLLLSPLPLPAATRTSGAVLGALALLALAVIVVAVATGTSPVAQRCAVPAPILVGALTAAVVALVSTATWDRTPGADPPLDGVGLGRAVDAVTVVVAVLLVVLGGVVAELARRFRARDDRPVPFGPMWRGAGAWLTAAIGVGTLVAVCGGLAFHVADLVGCAVAGAFERCGTDDEIAVPLGATLWAGAWTTAALLLVVAVLALPVAAVVFQRRAAAVWFAAASAAGVGAATLDTVLASRWPGVVLTAAAVALVGLGCRSWWRDREVRALVAVVTADYADAPASDAPADLVEPAEVEYLRIARRWRRGQTKYRLALPLGLVASLLGAATVWCGVVGLLSLVPPWRSGGPAPATYPLAPVGAYVSAALVLGLVGLGAATFRNKATRTRTGVLWDLVSFWPRVVHPLCPPPYGGRAVREVASRVEDLLDGHGDDRPEPSDRMTVVLSGHSQGSLICAAAALQLCGHRGRAGTGGNAPDTSRVALLTYGSQLQWAFARLFPCFVGYHHLARLNDRLGGRWHNLYRETDPLGGPVLTWSHRGPGRRPDLPQQRGGRFPAPAGSAVEPAGERLLDPRTAGRRRDRARDEILGHGGYYDVEEFDTALDRLAAGLVGPPAGRPRVPPTGPDPSRGPATPARSPLPSGGRGRADTPSAAGRRGHRSGHRGERDRRRGR